MNQPFVPNIISFKKSRRREKRGKETLRIVPVLYQYGIAVCSNCKLFSNHLEMMRKTITNFYKRSTSVFIRAFPNASFTKKGEGVRLGRGKGAVDSWYTYVRENKVIAEFESASYLKALAVVKIVNSKLPVRIKLLTNEFYSSELAIAMSKKRGSKK